MKTRKAAVTAAMMLAFSSLLVSAAPAFAQTGSNSGGAEPGPDSTPPPGAEIAELTPQEEAFLEDNGVEGEITVQEDAQGAAMYLDDEGDWVLTLPSPETPPGEVAPLWGAGICVGNFYMPIKVGSYLEWGGQNACSSAPPNAVYPHYLDTMLRDTCQGFGCIVVDDLWNVRSNNSWYATVATVADSRYCVETGDRAYSIVARPTVHGTQYGPFVSATVDVDGCHVHPAPGGV